MFNECLWFFNFWNIFKSIPWHQFIDNHIVITTLCYIIAERLGFGGECITIKIELILLLLQLEFQRSPLLFLLLFLLFLLMRILKIDLKFPWFQNFFLEFFLCHIISDSSIPSHRLWSLYLFKVFIHVWHFFRGLWIIKLLWNDILNLNLCYLPFLFGLHILIVKILYKYIYLTIY